MNIEFDPIADALYIQLAEGDVEFTKELKPGMICDYDESGNMLGVEVFPVSKRSELPLKEVV